MKIYSVYDSKAEAYLQPFFVLKRGLAIRAIQEAIKDEKSNLSKYPADFTLFELGDWNEDTGQISMLAAKINLGNCLELNGSQTPAVQVIK